MRIDWWTLALQTVNVLILIWILSRFLFRPVVAMIDERRAATAKVLSDAEAAKKQAIAAREAAEQEGARIAAARDDVLRQAAEDCEAQRAAALAPAREEVDQMRSAAETEMRWTRAAEESAASDRSAKLAVDIAAKMLARLPDSRARRRLRRRTGEGARLFAARPAATGSTQRRRDFRRRGRSTAEETRSCRDAIAAALGRPLDFVVAVDPGLIAGLELETPHAVVRNSFRNDLSRIVEELTRHDRVHG